MPGFTLLELLVVIAILAMLMVLTVPGITSTLRASHLNTAGRALVDQINLARQVTRSRNLPVEVRLYRLPDYNQPATDPVGTTSGVFRAFQILLVDENGAIVPLSRPEYLQSPVVISPGSKESALLADTNASHAERAPAATDPNLGTYGKNYRFVPFQFSPGGTTDLTAGKDFVTLVLQNDKPLSDGVNFFTVQIDPVSGSARSFRP